MGKPTPGPWRAYLDSLTVHSIDLGMTYNPTNMICTISGLGDMEMEVANARLIAAAPDMLNALKTTLTCPALDDDVRSLIAGVIARAEGRV